MTAEGRGCGQLCSGDEHRYREQRGQEETKRPHQLTVLTNVVLTLSELCKHWTLPPTLPPSNDFICHNPHHHFRVNPSAICDNHTCVETHIHRNIGTLIEFVLNAWLLPLHLRGGWNWPGWTCLCEKSFLALLATGPAGRAQWWHQGTLSASCQG